MAYNVVFPQGTKTIFTQQSAPVGWTKITTFGSMQNVQGAAIRISNADASFLDGQPFETVFSNANILGSLSISPTAPGSPTITVNLDSGNTTLTEAQMPKHTHLRRAPGTGYDAAGFGVISYNGYVGAVTDEKQVGAYVAYGPGPGKAVRFTGVGDHYTDAASPNITNQYPGNVPGLAAGSHKHTIAVTLTTLPTPINFSIKYVDCIIASKD